MKAIDILKAAQDHMSARAVTYDKPDGERSMAKTVEIFNLYHELNLTEKQGWHFMMILKEVRFTQREAFHQDSAEDLVAYGALMGEASSRTAVSDGGKSIVINLPDKDVTNSFTLIDNDTKVGYRTCKVLEKCNIGEDGYEVFYPFWLNNHVSPVSGKNVIVYDSAKNISTLFNAGGMKTELRRDQDLWILRDKDGNIFTVDWSQIEKFYKVS